MKTKNIICTTIEYDVDELKSINIKLDEIINNANPELRKNLLHIINKIDIIKDNLSKKNRDIYKLANIIYKEDYHWENMVESMFNYLMDKKNYLLFTASNILNLDYFDKLYNWFEEYHKVKDMIANKNFENINKINWTLYNEELDEYLVVYFYEEDILPKEFNCWDIYLEKKDMKFAFFVIKSNKQIPEWFDQWEIKDDKTGKTVAHEAAKLNKLPKNFPHLFLTDNNGKTVAQEYIENV